MAEGIRRLGTYLGQIREVDIALKQLFRRRAARRAWEEDRCNHGGAEKKERNVM